jgi:hypothetical protein
VAPPAHALEVGHRVLSFVIDGLTFYHRGQRQLKTNAASSVDRIRAGRDDH